jgi:hypothetical protein
VIAACAIVLLARWRSSRSTGGRPWRSRPASASSRARAALFVGAAVDANALANEANYRTVPAREYNGVTAENGMNWGVWWSSLPRAALL